MKIIVVIFLFLQISVFAKQTICLNMIVKDEEGYIERCLHSVAPFIDYWVIVDTGSTDNTKSIISNILSDIPGELHDRDWKNFAYNRNEALALAKDKCDYILLMDGDDWLEYETGFSFPYLMQDCYYFHLGSEHFTLFRTQLVKSDLDWKWTGVVHEYISVDGMYTYGTIENLYYRLGWKPDEEDKFLDRIEILLEALQEDPKDARYIFYLAESYKDAGDPINAITWYKKRVDIGGWREEIFWSLLQIAKMHKLLGHDEDIIIDAFNKAFRYSPHRGEPLYYLAEYCNDIGRYDLAYSTLQLRKYHKFSTSIDLLFYEKWIDSWGLAYQHLRAAFYLGRFTEVISLANHINQSTAIAHIKNDTNKYYELALQALHHQTLPASEIQY
ncbi:MAG: glycosyltransferase [Chlamydiales bacterium]